MCAGSYPLVMLGSGAVGWPPIALAVASVALAAGWRSLPRGRREDLAGLLGVLWLLVAAQSLGTALALPGGVLAVCASAGCLLAALRS